jgi:lipoprotein-anchoring transpeptidase ErfK/SrfK
LAGKVATLWKAEAFERSQDACCDIPATGAHTMLESVRCSLEVTRTFELSGIEATQNWHRRVNYSDEGSTMSLRGSALLLIGVLLGGCMQATLEPASEANLNPRDKKLLANAPYAKATIPQLYQRHIVDYHRNEAPGSIVVDTDARYLYYVLDNKKAIRYGVTVGEEAQAWSGVARVGNKQEWPAWIPTPGEHERLGQLPARVEGGPHNPMGARGIYLYQGNKDTLFRIHGTNQPEYIGQAISSGCIRMTNEDVIDLYNRVKMGAIVVVLAPQQGDSPINPRVALGNAT